MTDDRTRPYYGDRITPGQTGPHPDPTTDQATTAPPKEDDEFWHNIWWVPDGKGMLRTAHLSECAAEIKRLRAEVRRLRDALNAGAVVGKEVW
jgi:hypothetical protein